MVTALIRQPGREVRVALSILLLAGALLGAAGGLFAQEEPARIALLIGNQAYDPSVGVLKNPQNDIALVSQVLASRGYQVLPLVKDATRVQILAAVRGLARQLNAAGPGAVGFLYYSGHGAAETETKRNMVFDACRNELRLPYRGSKGFEPVREQPGIYVAYTTAPGQAAMDDGVTSGPYAAALASELAKPGIDHLSLFQNVKEAVYASTKGAQQPWATDGLIRRVYLTGWSKAAGSGESFKDCPDCPEMVVLPSGSFLMGSPEGEEGPEAVEGPQHKVTIAKPFAVGRTHITRGEFSRFVKATGHKTDGGCYAWTAKGWNNDKTASWRSPGFEQDDESHPVVCVNWNDAKAYVAWLSKTTGKPYRLLSEAEAEYAARGVTVATAQPRYFFGNDAKDLCQHGNGADETAKEKFPGWTVAPCKDGYVFTAPVMSFRSNPFGLYDVQGNAWSWVEDCKHENYNGAPSDGSAWTSGDCSRRILRGGSWFSLPQGLRAAFRNLYNPGDRNFISGFRVARTLNP